ncbi:MAG: hypothetical protein ABS75_18135 [Pelagibacterium sp. SCN 63-23]|nr:MAG: hypothetical protein ABS75_18135 [Pelagibacterium sp. SCN 63-23]
MSDEPRGAPRYRTLKGGKIVVNNGFSTFDCTIRNLSETGAKLRVVSAVGIPLHFQLALDDGRTFDCEIAWRKQTELGVRFL